MRRTSVWIPILALAICSFALTPPAAAETFHWSLSMRLGQASQVHLGTSGIGDASVSRSGSVITQVQIGAGQIAGTAVATSFPAPYDILTGLTAFFSNWAGTIVGGTTATQGTLGIGGWAHVQISSPFISSQWVPLTLNGTQGIGLGGTVPATWTGFPLVTALASNGPFVAGPVSFPFVGETTGGGPTTHTATASAAGQWQTTGGGTVIQLVAPTVVNVPFLGNQAPLFTFLDLQFAAVPEPSTLPLLGTATALLAVGAWRARRS